MWSLRPAAAAILITTLLMPASMDAVAVFYQESGRGAHLPSKLMWKLRLMWPIWPCVCMSLTRVARLTCSVTLTSLVIESFCELLGCWPPYEHVGELSLFLTSSLLLSIGG